MANARSEVAPAVDVPSTLRQSRERRGLRVTELARRVGVTHSAISQYEAGRTRPSIDTLWAIVGELGITLDDLFPVTPPADPAMPSQRRLQRGRRRLSIELDSGVRWERLTPQREHGTEFLFMTYDVGGTSTSGDMRVAHPGREYGLLLEGTLELVVGERTHVLEAGDSIVFDAAEPHRMRALGSTPAKAVWMVVGRR